MLATDRPIGFWETVNRPRMVQYPFTVIQMQIEAADAVIRDGYRIINVEKPDDAESVLSFIRPYDVFESRPTVIKLAIDLDSTLIQRANSYRFRPYYYVSAIE